MLNKTIFVFREKEIKGKHLFIVLILLLLLLCLKMCSQKKDNKQDTINTVVNESCKFYALNIEDLSQLLIAGNICEDEWFEELDIFIARLEEQNVGLKADGRKEALIVEGYQAKLSEALELFRRKPNETTLEDLKVTYDEYVTHYSTIKEGCEK